MAANSRKSLGAVRFDMENSPSSTISPSRRRRSIAAPKVIASNIEENDDEAERLARRERNENGSPASTPLVGSERRQSAFGLSAIANVTVEQMKNQIAQCIKLSAENKINDKNAFQLKMIDFLVYALKKQDPNMTNLQMASASLDASAKIYGFRVDKVHSDLLKILGMAKQDKRNQDDNNDEQNVDQPDERKKDGQQKKKKKNKHIISTVEALRRKETENSALNPSKCQWDTQTSDMLSQACLPQHANQGIALNLCNDIIVDKTLEYFFDKPSKMFISKIEDNLNLDICPSYAAYKFLDWSPDIEPEEPDSQTEVNDGEYHFDLDAAVPDDDIIENDVMMDCGDAFEERCGRLAQTNQPFENIVDFQDIIANNPNPNATYEYSYLQRSYRIHWAGPSHWKIIMNKNLQGSRVVETCKQNAIRKKKDIELTFTTDSKEEAKIKFSQINRQTKISGKTTKLMWSEDKLTFPEDIHYDLKRYNIFFNKPTEHLRFCNDERTENLSMHDNDINLNDSDNHDFSNYAEPDGEYFGDHNGDENQNPSTQETIATQTQGGFVGDNLVSVPKLTDKIFIPYSQRAKKIDMRQLKKTMWKNLKKSSKETEKENVDITQAHAEQESEINKAIEPKVFSDMYTELPKMLTRVNAESLSPAIAFVSLLHLANERNLSLDEDSQLTDVTIKPGGIAT